MTADTPRDSLPPVAPPGKALTDAARRALAEAAARRAAIDAEAARLKQVAEINGREGPEPVRYGDWENKGITSDF
ncbi:MAG: DUF1674 domain-containing protein [Beijerinckiaceae bacterium]